jgi:hypothetical protein
MLLQLNTLSDEEFAQVTGLRDCTAKEAARLVWGLVGSLAVSLVGAVKLTVLWGWHDLTRVFSRTID